MSKLTFSRHSETPQLKFFGLVGVLCISFSVVASETREAKEQFKASHESRSSDLGSIRKVSRKRAEPRIEDEQVLTSPNLLATSHSSEEPNEEPKFLSLMTAEKGNLFRLILSTAEVECDYVQQARCLLKKLVESRSSVELTERDSLESLLEELKQPEDWFAGLDVSEAINRSKEFEDFKEFIKKLSGYVDQLSQQQLKEKGILIEILELVLKQYGKFESDLLLAKSDEVRKGLLSPKALLTGEGFLEESDRFPAWWKESFNTLSKEKLVISYRLSQSQARNLCSVDKYGFTNKKNKAGANAVKSITLDGKEGVHFKRATTPLGLLTGTEMAAYWLSRALFGHGVAPTALLSLMNVLETSSDHPTPGFQAAKNKDKYLKEHPEELEQMTTKRKSYLLQASKHVPGKMLYDLLKSKDPMQWDPQLFTGQVILSLLINHADGKADNFIVGRGEVTSIDTGLSFESDVFFDKRTEKAYMQSRNILLLLSEMQEKMIDAKVITMLTQIDPKLVIMQWLELLYYQDELYRELRTVINHNLKQDSPILLDMIDSDIKLSPEIVIDIYEKLKTIKELCKNGSLEANDHWVLFYQIRPLAAAFYDTIRKNDTYRKSVLTLFKEKIYQKHQKDFSYLDDIIDLGAEFLDSNLRAKLKEMKIKRTSPVSVIELARLELKKTDLKVVIDLKHYLESAVGAFGQSIIRSGRGLSKELHASWRNPKDLLVRALGHNCTPQVIDFLFECGLDPLAFDKNNKNALYHICYGKFSYADQIRWLRLIKKWCHKKTIEFDKVINEICGRDAQKNKNTSLACAVKADNTALVMFLINEGASMCDPEELLAFFARHRLAEQPTAFEVLRKLFEKNSELFWRFSLESVMPKTDGESALIKDSQKVKRTFSQDAKTELFVKEKKLKPFDKTRKGRVVSRCVADLRFGMELYFKKLPELPGLEEATGGLMRRLFGHGAPHTELIRFQNVPIQISQGIKGKTLAELFEEENYEASLRKISPSSVSALILGAMLTNPEDGKPGNYVLAEDHQLWCVDNDHSFVKGFIREKPYSGVKSTVPVVQVKTVLFCLPQMNEEIDDSIRKRIVSIADPKKFIEDWLEALKLRKLAHEQLFTPEERFDLKKNRNSYIGIPFRYGVIFALYTKLVRMQKLFAAPSKLTHMDVLMRLEPFLAKRYQKGFKIEPKSTLLRWVHVDAPFYKEKKQGGYMTLSQTGHILSSFALRPKKWLDEFESGILDPATALKNFQENHDSSIEKYKQKLLDWAKSARESNIIKLCELLPSDSKKLAELLTLLSESCDDISDWTGLFKAVKEANVLEELLLRNNHHITALLVDYLDLTGLMRVDVRGCENFGSEGAALLAAKAHSLEELNLGNSNRLEKLGSAKQPLLFLKMRTLNLSGCSNLKKMYICAPLLTYFAVKGTLLTELQLDGIVRTHRALQQIDCNEQMEYGLRKWAPLVTYAEIFDEDNGVYNSEKLFIIGTLVLCGWDNKLINKLRNDSEQGKQHQDFYAALSADKGRVDPIAKALNPYSKLLNEDTRGWAHYRSGLLYSREDSGIQGGLELSNKYFEQAYKKGFDYLQYLLDPTIGGSEDDRLGLIEGATYFYEKAAKMGQPYAKIILNFSSKILPKAELEEVFSRDEKMVILANIAVKMDSGAAHYNFARCLEYGYGVEKDREMAVKHYYRAAKKEIREAREKIAFCFKRLNKSAMDKLKKSDSHFIELLKLAAQLGYGYSGHNVGIWNRK